ncbi:MAG: hypothetical protein HOO04_05830 [Phycisphaerae bacterium]|nr:hypothetical protein [Phycisphaerae bacterium]MBT5656464.1 hypothetical protein [Phycisphaerae bacterium]
MRRFSVWTFGVMVTAILFVSPLVMAQSELQLRAFQGDPELTAVPSGGPSPLFGLAISLFLALAVVGVSLMPSKRGHQD